MNYFTRNKASLLPEVQQVWGKNGYRTSGTGAEVFGTDERADEIFMAYYIGRFIGDVAKAGEAELNIPMYANAWLGPQPGADLPGEWPSGGPVAGVLDVSFALVVNTALNEFLLIGANGDPTFEPDSPGPSGVTVVSGDEGSYNNGTWIPGRRLNGDELFVPGLPGPQISMLKVRLLTF